MAREAGFNLNFRITGSNEALDRLVEYVRADEREACAKVCDDWPNGRDDVYLIGEAIRARSNT
jgi:hypothetical protein